MYENDIEQNIVPQNKGDDSLLETFIEEETIPSLRSNTDTSNSVSIEDIYNYSQLNTHVNILSCIFIVATFVFIAFYTIANAGRKTK